MDSLIRERNGKDEIWYSEKYLIEQMELAYQAGIHKGFEIEFHSVEPMHNEMVDKLVLQVKKRLDEEFQNALKKGEIWRIAK